MEPGSWINLISAFGGLAGVAALAMVVVNWWGRRGELRNTSKTVAADSAEKISNSAVKLVEQYEDRLAAVENRVREAESRIRRLSRTVESYARRVVYLMDGIERLVAQLVAAGAQPIWKPDDWKPEDSEEQQ